MSILPVALFPQYNIPSVVVVVTEGDVKILVAARCCAALLVVFWVALVASPSPNAHINTMSKCSHPFLEDLVTLWRFNPAYISLCIGVNQLLASKLLETRGF